ncbi:MAG: hypothetical protein FJ295_11755 [Planctomycetes bacterium]|nr:hypothetical protein [Planctomycetota bacterium]
MSLFGNLFRLFKPKPRTAANDSVFGHIEFEQGIWMSIPHSRTAGFMVSVDASDSGPSQLQRDFFQQIRDNLSEFEQRARDFMRSRVEPGVEVSSLSIYSVEIGADDATRQQRFVLEMSDTDEIEVHRVEFLGGFAVEYGCDD